MAEPSVSLNNYPMTQQRGYMQEPTTRSTTVSHGRYSNLPMVWSDKHVASNRSFWKMHAVRPARRLGASCHDARYLGLLNLSRSDDSVSHRSCATRSLSWLVGVARRLVAAADRNTCRKPPRN